MTQPISVQFGSTPIVKFFGTKSTNGSQGLLSRASLDPFATSRLCHSQSQHPQRMPRNLGKPKPQHIRVQWPWWPGSSLVANIWKQRAVVEDVDETNFWISLATERDFRMKCMLTPNKIALSHYSPRFRQMGTSQK